jgi:ABC-2 type transport system ATP-binding protein
MSASPAIRVTGLEKRYGATTAVDGISFQIAPGEVFCLLGPNGAGKTTTIECLEGYRKPDAGEIRVLGMDPQLDETTLRRRIGVQLQEASLPARLRVWEILQLFSVLYERPAVPWELLERLGLEAKRDTYFDKLSGGQKQRLFVALALINEPEVVFLDEITTGLDPRARHSIWELIRGIQNSGTTVVLTTHFMDEAEALADRVAIMKSGRLVANDAPATLIAGVPRGEEVQLHIEGEVDLSAIEAVEGVIGIEPESGGLTARGGGRGWIARLVAAIDGQDAMLVDLSTRRPSLEDVYLQLTGEEEYEPEGTSPEEYEPEDTSPEDGP